MNDKGASPGRGRYIVIEGPEGVGKTTQIEMLAHRLEAAGYPVAGDKLYGRPDEVYLAYLKHLEKRGELSGGGDWETPRQLLHSWKLELTHPVTQERMQWEAPMPKDMKEFIEANK